MLKITKKMQYGLLLVLYLFKAGRSTVHNAATNLNLSVSFLEQVAHKLKLAGVLKSFKGSGGGYEVVGSPTVEYVFWHLGGEEYASEDPVWLAASPHQEFRAMSLFSAELAFAQHAVLKKPVVSLLSDLMIREAKLMDSRQESGVDS